MFLLISCYIADLIFGDPEWFPHPVRGIGKLINRLDKRLNGKSNIWVDPVRNQRFSNGVERIKGVILALVVVGISSCCAYLFIELLKRLNPLLGSLAWVYLGYVTLSIKDLKVKTKAILKEIEKDSIIGAQKQLSKIVSRDTHNLNQDKIIVATIESIAESTNDGIVAPLFYLILGGPVLAVAYKSINTLDSMVGYRNERYLHFGWFSAKLDDIVNFIPARITGFLMSASALISGKMVRQVVRQAHHPSNHPERSRRRFVESFKIMLRDGTKHPSPNSGISEAAMAGALGIKLGGIWSYQDKVSSKPCLGEEKRNIQPSFINEALTISLITSILMVSIGAILAQILS